MEASQETCFWAKIQNYPNLPPDLSNGMFLIRKLCHTVICIFSKAYVEKLERNYVDKSGSGGDSYRPRSQQHFKESDKMEASYLFFLLFGSAP